MHWIGAHASNYVALVIEGIQFVLETTKSGRNEPDHAAARIT